MTRKQTVLETGGLAMRGYKVQMEKSGIVHPKLHLIVRRAESHHAGDDSQVLNVALGLVSTAPHRFI